MAESTPPGGPQQLQTGDTQPGPESDSNRTPVPHVIPNSPLSAEAQMQVQGGPSPYGGVFPGSIPQLELRPLVPGLVCGSCSPPDLSWLPVNTITIAPESSFGFSPCMLFPVHSPPELCFLPPPSPLLLPQTVSFYQPCSPDLVTGRAAQVVSQQQREEQAEAGEEWQKNTSVNNNLQVNNNNPDDGQTNCAEPLPHQEEDFLAEQAFEEYMVIMDSLPHEIQQTVTSRPTEDEQNQDVEPNQLDSETRRLMEYLDEVCSDEEFVKKLDSVLDPDYVDSFLSAGPDLVDFLTLDKKEEEPLDESLQQYLRPLSADSSPAAERTHTGPPLLPSKLLEEPLDPRPTTTCVPGSVMSPPHCRDPVFQDWTCGPCPLLFHHISLVFDLEGGDNDPNREGLSEQTSQKQEVPGPVTVKDPEPGFRPDLELEEHLNSKDSKDGKFSCLQGESGCSEGVGTKTDRVRVRYSARLSRQEKGGPRGEAMKSRVSTQEEKDSVQGKVKRPERRRWTKDQLSGDLGPAPGPTKSREKKDHEESPPESREDGETFYNLRSKTRSKTRESKKRKTRAEDSKVSSSPMKRGRWKRGRRLE